jgi:hypothetical protein
MGQLGRPRKDAVKAVIATPTPLPNYSHFKSDSWSNALTGLNLKQDKSQYTKYGSAYILDDGTLAEMYVGDGLASRIVDIIADDMTREWVSLEGPHADKILKDMAALDAEEKFNTAIRWQRLFGGAIMIIGAMDSRTPDQPLDEKNIKGIEYLRVLDRTAVEIVSSEFDMNPMHSTFGQIIRYHLRFKVNTEIVEMKIHHTRVIPFMNDPIPNKLSDYFTQDTRYWGMSSIQRIYEGVRDLGGVSQSIVNILYEFMLGTYKFEGLAELLASTPDKDGKSGASLLAERLNAINTSKSVLNGIVLDKEEDYSRQFATLAGLPEIMDRFMLNLSGSTSIPVTRLFGRSPAGLNATGENDLRNYYDLIEANQRNRLLPAIQRIVSFIQLWRKYKGEVEVTFNSLYQMTEKEIVEVTKIEAINFCKNGIRDPAEVSREYGYEPPEDVIPPDAEPLPEEEEVGEEEAEEK